MSRVGKKPVPVPAGVSVAMEGRTLTVRGPRGELRRTFRPEVAIAHDGGAITVTRAGEGKFERALHGLSRALVANMVEGVTSGYQKTLEVLGTGYRASKSGAKLLLNVGYSHPVEYLPPAGVEIDVPQPNTIVVRGIDKEQVGQVAAQIRGVRPPSPYGADKGIKYSTERVRKKAGKAGK